MVFPAVVSLLASAYRVFVMLMAAALREQYSDYVPLWRDTRSSTQYSGALFPFRVGTDREENVIKLSVGTDTGKMLNLTVSGTVQAQELTLSTGRPTGRLSPAGRLLQSDDDLPGTA